MNRAFVLAALVASCAWTIGCGGSKPPPPTATSEPTAEATTTEEAPPPPKKSAKEVLLGEGASFGLSYVDSLPLKKAVTEACARKNKQEDKQQACRVEAETAAGDEGLRIEKDGDKLWLVLFGKDKGKDAVHHKLQVTIEGGEAEKLVLKPQGKDAGTTKQAWKKLPESIVIEVPDEQTLKVGDPDRGTLTYKLK